jgi:hypothetical protein
MSPAGRVVMLKELDDATNLFLQVIKAKVSKWTDQAVM